jgi:hypothetical protein
MQKRLIFLFISVIWIQPNIGQANETVNLDSIIEVTDNLFGHARCEETVVFLSETLKLCKETSESLQKR